MYKVYIKTDPQNRITTINSDSFLSDTDGWALIDEGESDRYHHAQGNYLPKSLMTNEGVYRYKLVSGKVTERSVKELALDIALIPPHPPSAEDRIKALEGELAALKPTVSTLVKDVAEVKLGVAK